MKFFMINTTSWREFYNFSSHHCISIDVFLLMKARAAAFHPSNNFQKLSA